MTPEQAQWRLAAAHKLMTHEEIAAHALQLANVLTGFDDISGGLHRNLAASTDRANGSITILQSLQPLVADLIGSIARNDTLRAFQIAIGINSILAPYTGVQGIPQVTQPPTLAAMWPDIFDPKGEANHG